MGSGSSVVKVSVGSSSGSLVGKLFSKKSISPFSLVQQAVTAISGPSSLQSYNEISPDCNKSIVSLDSKLLSIRDLVDDDRKRNSDMFQKLAKKNGHEAYLEKFQILENIERKIFCRMLMVEHIPNEYHQLDEIVSLEAFLTLDSASSAPIHMVCEKLRRFVCNYQTSYERWLEILSSLQDELLMQLIGDYDEYYMGCIIINHQDDPVAYNQKKKEKEILEMNCHCEELIVTSTSSHNTHVLLF